MTWKQQLIGFAIAVTVFATVALGAGADWFG